MTPYHVARSKLFDANVSARWRWSISKPLRSKPNLSTLVFLFPEEEQHAQTDDFPGLLRAADLIGQLAHINYLR